MGEMKRKPTSTQTREQFEVAVERARVAGRPAATRTILGVSVSDPGKRAIARGLRRGVSYRESRWSDRARQASRQASRHANSRSNPGFFGDSARAVLRTDPRSLAASGLRSAISPPLAAPRQIYGQRHRPVARGACRWGREIRRSPSAWLHVTVVSPDKRDGSPPGRNATWPWRGRRLELTVYMALRGLPRPISNQLKRWSRGRELNSRPTDYETTGIGRCVPTAPVSPV
jgi:hypothetical protein